MNHDVRLDRIVSSCSAAKLLRIVGHRSFTAEQVIFKSRYSPKSKLDAMFKVLLLTAALVILVQAHDGSDHEDQVPIAGPHESLWYNALPGDGGTQVGLNQIVVSKPTR